MLDFNNENWMDSLAKLNHQDITNELMIQIGQKLQNESSSSRSENTKKLISSLQSVYEVDLSWLDSTQLLRVISTLKQKRANLQKSKSREKGKADFELFLKEPFSLPVKRTKRKAACNEKSVPGKEMMHEDPNDALIKIQEFKRQNSRLRVQLETTRLELRKTKCQLTKSNARLKNVYALVGKAGTRQPKYVVQSLQRKTMSAQKWKEKYKKLRKESQSERLHRKLQLLREKNRRLSVQNRYMRKQQKKRRETTSPMNVPHQKCPQGCANKALKESSKYIQYLENQLVQQLDDNTIQTRIGNTYTSEIREASYYLQDLGISEKNTSEAIRAVVETTTGKKLGPLPSSSTQNRFAGEMKALSRKHISEELLGCQDMTLKYDGTTKSLGHLAEVEVASQDDTFLLGVRQQLGGKAEDYVETIKDVCGQTILPQIKNTMTDRCVTNDAIDNMLRDDLGELNSFRCGMHPLDSFYHACEAALRKEDQEDAQSVPSTMPFRKGQESQTHALLRAIDKLFNDLGCGCGKDLRTFIHSKGYTNTTEIEQKSEIYFRFVGNRFNIYFLNAMLAFSYSKIIQEFFSKIQRPSNNLQSAVMNALQSGRCDVPMQALGIIAKYVTGPWMRLLSESRNILEMNDYYQEAVTTLDRWISDPSLMLKTRSSIFASVPMKDDKYFEELLTFRSQEEQARVESSVVILLKEIRTVILRQLKTQLPGGCFWNPNEKLKEQAKSVSSHNISGERKFAVVDSYLHRAPSASMGHIESKTMFKCNKTAKWLKKKSTTSKKRHILEAISLGRKIVKEDRARAITRRQRLKERMNKMKKELSEREERARMIQEHLIEDVLQSGGVWTTENEMKKNIKGMTKGKLLRSLKAQINLRTKILGAQKKIIFAKSTIDELQIGLTDLLKEPVREDKKELYNYLCDPTHLINKRFEHKWQDEGKETWWTGTILSVQKGEFNITYEGDNKSYFLSPEEMLSDLVAGDLSILN